MDKLKTRQKDKVGTLKTRPNKTTQKELVQDSLKRVHSNEAEFFLVKLI